MLESRYRSMCQVWIKDRGTFAGEIVNFAFLDHQPQYDSAITARFP